MQIEYPTGSGRPPRIVIVNDEPYILEAMDMMIRAWLKDVTIVAHGDSDLALEELLLIDPDILFMDDHMPKRHGFEIVERLAAKCVTYPIILTSGSSEAEWVKQWIWNMAGLGLNISCLPVPFTIELLKEEISKHFNLETAP